MPATVTLATTTLTYGVNAGAGEVELSSVSGINPGYRLWIDRELMKVLSIVTGTTRVKVSRGVDGTAASAHSSTSTVTIGRGDQFYTTDPVGAPPAEILVSPYINVINGKTWYAQGDAEPSLGPVRWWQQPETTYSYGALGIRESSVDLTSST